MCTMPAIENLPLFPDVVRHVTAIRHDLHRHPELGFQERYTSTLISRELTRLGIEHRTGLAGGTGILATIRGGGPGKCVALRADIDALPIHEETNLPYASETPGKMHACGHDGHTSVLLGTAAILQHLAPQLPGTIQLIFQPAEEFGAGAERMCKDGVLDGVEAIFGLHGWPGLKIGKVGTRPGPLLASVDGFAMVISGRGGHAASPEACVDPVVAGAAIVQGLQTVVAREIGATDSAVLTISEFHAGTAFNIIPDTARLSGTIRALSPAIRKQVFEALERLAHGIAAAYRCKVEITRDDGCPVTVNTPAMAEFVKQTAVQTLGHHHYIDIPRPTMWGEDFAYYLQQVPGCFYVLGVQQHDRDSHPMLHNPLFDFSDGALPVGIQMMVSLATRFVAS